MPETTPHSLGRLVEHDPMSAGFAVPGLPMSAVRTVRWDRKIPILDQDNLHAQGIRLPDAGDPDSLGSCTGNAGTGLLGTEPYASGLALDLSDLTEQYAIRLYSDATHVDRFDGEFPPDDTGSSGLAICKVLRRRHLASSYRHAFGLRATLSALTSGPVLLGIQWHESMFDADQSGRFDIAGAVVGGHEVVVEGLDMEAHEVLVANSWSASWGMNGYFRLRFDQLDLLLHQHGDVSVPARPH